MIAELRPLRLPLRLRGTYSTVRPDCTARVICVNRRHPKLPVVVLVQGLNSDQIMELTSEGKMWLTKGANLERFPPFLTGELTGFYLGDPVKPGAYWCETVGGTGKSPGWRWWDGEKWSMSWSTKRDCKNFKDRHRKSSRKLPLRWREEKEK